MSTFKEFDFAQITFNKPTKVQKMYISKFLYNKEEINLQLKRKITPTGIYRESNKYYIDLIFDFDNKRDLNFVKLYKQLEMTSIKEIHEKYNEWMNVEEKLEWEDVYTSFKSQLTNEDEVYKIKFNLMTHNNMMETIFYNENLDKISFKEVDVGDELTIILNFKGIKFGKEKFENLWQIIQAKVYKMDDILEENQENQEKCLFPNEYFEETNEMDEMDGYESSIDIEQERNFDKKIQEKYKKYKEEESLKIIS